MYRYVYMLLNVFFFSFSDVSVAELLYALQWCKEVEHSPTFVSTYFGLLTEWELSGGLHDLVTTTDLLEMLYSRSGSLRVL